MRRYLTTRRGQGREDSGELARWTRGSAEEVPDQEGDGRLMICPSILCCLISAILPRQRPPWEQSCAHGTLTCSA
jgi:hypothetical protein